MSLETMLWVLGGAVFPVLGWGCWITLVLTNMSRDVLFLTEAHRSPNEHGFGTDETKEAIREQSRKMTHVIEENTRAVQALTHYIEWMSKNSAGIPPVIPPPPLKS